MNHFETSTPASLSVGLVTPGWPSRGFANGIATYVATLVPPLRRMGHSVSILARNVAEDVHDPTIYDLRRYPAPRSRGRRWIDALSYRLGRGSGAEHWRLSFLKTALAMIAERGTQLVEIEESFGFASWLKQSSDVSVCVRLHGPWFLNGPALGAPEDRVFRSRVRLEGEAIAAADGITAPSQDVLARVRAHYALELPHAKVIPGAILAAPSRERWASSAADPNRVLFVGRFDRHKGGDVVIEAFARILEKVPAARLTFVGPDRGCVTADGRTWTLPEFVRSRLPGALESGSVEWLGQQPGEAVAALRRRAAVTVVASRYENLPYTVAEALAVGSPIVATRAGGIPEMIRDGSAGLLCRPGDPADLAEKVSSLLADRERAAALGCQAALDCERLFDPDVIAARTVEYYRAVLARRWSGSAS